MAMVLKECGHTSEAKRQVLDHQTLSAEFLTKSTPWDDPNISMIRQPSNFYEATSLLHLSYHNLIFKIKHLLRATSDENEWQSIPDSVDFEFAHTTNRKEQADCLGDRITIQIEINNLIARQTTSQTNLIAFLALTFAPASLIASIFGADIFGKNKQSWIHYIVSTIVVTFVTVAIGFVFLQRQKLT
ncbi:hypothetical protein F5Y19DRAFT_492526 [Xylariaceae sp. FL1651]|nr:hypothetical protein F5Y19DRAFT_492526 [Xylariaceae sp. FL1651]